MTKFFCILLLICSVLFSSCSATTKKQEQDLTEKEETKIVEDQEKTPQKKSKYERAKELEKNFKTVDRGNVNQVLPNHIGKDGEGIYCYFLKKGKRAVSLSLHIQYSQYNADLFELSAAGKTMSYEANKSHTSGKNFQIAEDAVFRWYAKVINREDEDFIRKIGETGKATLLLKNKGAGNVVATINLTKAECKALVDAVDYYLALNGAKIPEKGMVNIRSF